jgi:hypothetical protein
MPKTSLNSLPKGNDFMYLFEFHFLSVSNNGLKVVMLTHKKKKIGLKVKKYKVNVF